MPKTLARNIGQSYLPKRAHYWYARCKLASDPLYAGVGAALCDTKAPLLDLGCGIGLLAHTLRAQGFAAPYRGIDNDSAKIAAACHATIRAGLANVQFDCIDLASEVFPAHRGSITLLDVLQFLPQELAQALIARTAHSIASDGRLVIRTGLDQPGARMRFTRTIDSFSRAVGWMNAAPHWYPARDELAAVLAHHGLRATFTPLSGVLPFNNWLVVAERS